MLKFPVKQKIYDINGVKLGGQPGELPTVMIGSIFYEGHKIVKDDKKGSFDKKKAEDIVNKALLLSDITGNPTVLDVIGDTSEALIKYIDFISSITDCPFLIDGSTAEVRIDASKFVSEVGLLDRAIYNTLQEGSTLSEKESIKSLKIQSCVVLAVNSRNPRVAGRVEMAKRLVYEAQNLNIKNILVDTGVLDMPDIGIASKSIYEIKREMGYPSGCAPANTIDMWDKLKKRGKDIFKVCAGFGNAMPSILGADWIMYGPIERAEYIYHVVAFSDAVVAYTMKDEGVKPLTKDHPLYLIF